MDSADPQGRSESRFWKSRERMSGWALKSTMTSPIIGKKYGSRRWRPSRRSTQSGVRKSGMGIQGFVIAVENTSEYRPMSGLPRPAGRECGVPSCLGIAFDGMESQSPTNVHNETTPGGRSCSGGHGHIFVGLVRDRENRDEQEAIGTFVSCMVLPGGLGVMSAAMQSPECRACTSCRSDRWGQN
jgi:hypothetical protein